MSEKEFSEIEYYKDLVDLGFHHIMSVDSEDGWQHTAQVWIKITDENTPTEALLIGDDGGDGCHVLKKLTAEEIPKMIRANIYESTDRKLGRKYEVLRYHEDSAWTGKVLSPVWNDMKRISHYLDDWPATYFDTITDLGGGNHAISLSVFKELLLLEDRLNKLNQELAEKLIERLPIDAAKDEENPDTVSYTHLTLPTILLV